MKIIQSILTDAFFKLYIWDNHTQYSTVYYLFNCINKKEKMD